MIYLDNSATTRPSPAAVSAVTRALEEHWGNPSSLHLLGVNAEAQVTAARETAARLLSCRPDEVIFTGCGTESNNTALLGAARKGKKRGNRIVASAIEHPSVLEPLKQLAEDGFEVVLLHPDKNGVIPVSGLETAINEKTILVSMMLVNNETGAVQPVKQAARIIREVGAPALLHCDAVQAFGKMPVRPAELGVDLLSASGHKLHAPKGIGLLYCRKGLVIPPLLNGGGQERGMRSGTESVPLICGFGAAMEELPAPERQLPLMRELRQYAADQLTGTGLCTVNSPADGLPYILNISVPGYRSETLLHFLESREIYVSSGSACAKGEGSYVLREQGLDRRLTDSALRLSFDRTNTKEEIDQLVSALTDAANRLRKSTK